MNFLRRDKFLPQLVGKLEVNWDMMCMEDPPEFLRCSHDIRNDDIVTYSRLSPDVLLFLLFPLLTEWTRSQPDSLGLWWPSLCSSGRWKSNSKSWSVCVGFLYTLMLRLLFSSISTAQSKKGRLSPLMCSCVDLVLLSTAFICSVKASTSLVLKLTIHIPEPVARSISCEGNQGSPLSFFHVEVGHYWRHNWAYGTTVILSVEAFMYWK